MHGLFEDDEVDPRGRKRRATGAAPSAVLQINDYPLQEMFEEWNRKERAPTDPYFETGGLIFSNVTADIVKVEREFKRNDFVCDKDDKLVFTEVVSWEGLSPWFM